MRHRLAVYDSSGGETVEIRCELNSTMDIDEFSRRLADFLAGTCDGKKFDLTMRRVGSNVTRGMKLG